MTTHFTFLTHGCNVLYTLEKAGYTFDQFSAFWGNLLIVERGGNGDNWYDRRQVEAFCAE